MALTVSQLISDIKYKLDDSSPTTAELLRLINLGRQEIAKEALCFRDTKTYSSSANTNEIDLTSDMYKVTNLKMGVENTNARILPLSFDQWDKLDFSQTGDRYNYYLEDGRTLIFYPTLTAGAQSTTLASTINTGATLITVASLSGLPNVGRALIGSEVISWYGLDTTNVQLKNVKRGLEGTTATSHNTGATLLLRNIYVDYFGYPSDVDDSDNMDDVFTRYPDIVTYYVCWQYKQKDTDDVQSTGSNAQAMFFRAKYEEAMNKLWFDMFNSNDTDQAVRRIRGR